VSGFNMLGNMLGDTHSLGPSSAQDLVSVGQEAGQFLDGAHQIVQPAM